MRELFLSITLMVCLSLPAQTKKYKVCIVAFYNLENFYDTVDNTLVNDEDFTPGGIKKYNTAIYKDKVNKLASVISLIGTDDSPLGATILGVAEIENDTVLNDLVHHPFLLKRNYKIIHFDSRDARGVDVGLLYDPKMFRPEKAEKLFVPLPGNSKEAFFTRDILYVKGSLAGETIHVYVNHWPSRRGGEERSSPARKAAALVCKHHLDSVLRRQPGAKIIVMGDLNDDPDSPSIVDALQARVSIARTKPGELFNPWAALYAEGIGTLANRDSWGLFDQIILSHAWLNRRQEGLFYHGAHIFSRNFMRENAGRYTGYPMRTWDGNTYRGGYSDHFPTYLVLLKAPD
ncbi:endonuclease/exonuclease/phosphatase [Sediminibacterium roseum]|uniref:Endonuclease/exonuclease/phosphatase n=1 Tax=Sediminibacterium roseum TaxID=1978412 RepID=A0ABX0A1J7_9BACT|nr:endonuclease/exonuclease/phosphatase [Sediminibacterium roseum]NCI51278.1 endonuclease/exonuclease/phosphatase [Sediminibacterium roseum]